MAAAEPAPELESNYAKLVIARSSGRAGNYRFIIDRYNRLKHGEISMSDYDREIQRLAQQPGRCVFCGSSAGYGTVEIMPSRLGSPVGMQNLVYACDECARSKGEQGLLEWWCDHLGRDKDDLPRIPAGLFLKMAHERQAISFTLDAPCKDIRDLWKT